MNSLKRSIANCSSLSALMLVLAATPLILTGCATAVAGSNQPGQIVPAAGISGSVYGGQSPIVGASIFMYAAGTTGYASANTNILTAGVTTNAAGTFSIAGLFSCTAGQQMYLAAVGGNPGAGTNNNEVTVAALGDCSTINAGTFVQMNEVTTVAAAYALAPFATGYANIGTSSTNVNGLKRAFVNAAKLANIANGTAVGTLPSGATAPTAEIYSIANAIAACVNSTTAGTPCTNLFTYTTPPAGAAPTNTFVAALNIAKYPTNNVSSIYTLGTATPPFASALGSAPSDWSVSITYTGGGTFNAPKSATVDANGQIWVANSGNNTLTVLGQNGTPTVTSPLTGNSLSTPVAIAIDNSGNAWVADSGNAKVSVFTNSGGTFSGSPFTVGTGPVALAFDASGNAWVANGTGNSISELSSTGSSLQTITLGGSPNAIAIDPK